MLDVTELRQTTLTDKDPPSSSNGSGMLASESLFVWHRDTRASIDAIIALNPYIVPPTREIVDTVSTATPFDSTVSCSLSWPSLPPPWRRDDHAQLWRHLHQLESSRDPAPQPVKRAPEYVDLLALLRQSEAGHGVGITVEGLQLFLLGAGFRI